MPASKKMTKDANIYFRIDTESLHELKRKSKCKGVSSPTLLRKSIEEFVSDELFAIGIINKVDRKQDKVICLRIDKATAERFRTICDGSDVGYSQVVKQIIKAK